MNTIIKYECEICRNKYDSPETAYACEAKGKANKKKYPIGLIYEHHHNGYVGIFAIAKVEYSRFSEHTIDFNFLGL